MPQLIIDRYDVDGTRHITITTPGGNPFELSNQGPNVVYLGAVQPSSTEVVDPRYGLPVAPGQTVRVPRSDPGDFLVLGANTTPGTESHVMIVGVGEFV